MKLKSFEWVEVSCWPQVDSNDMLRVVVRVKMTGDLSLHYTRLDLASRGLVTDSHSEYILPDGSVKKFEK